MHIDDFDYELPPELIARFPAEKRDASKMMKVNRLTGETEVSDFPDFLTFIEFEVSPVLQRTLSYHPEISKTFLQFNVSRIIFTS